MKNFLQKHLDDLLITAGATLVVYATWLLSWVAALYVAGGLLIIFGILVGLGNRPHGFAPMARPEGAVPKEGGER